MNKHTQIVQNSGNYTFKRVQHQGRPHLVVPVVMIVEGVHCGSAGCLYYNRNVINDTANLWNNMAVPVYHPVDSQGNPVDCNKPDVINDYVVGNVFDAYMSADKLKANIYFDEERLSAIDNELYQRILRNEPIEVSTGLSDIQAGPGGVCNGQEYIASVEQMTPNHLAVLPNEVGACSIEDGCGVRNKKGDSVNEDDKTTIINKLKVFADGLFSKKESAVNDDNINASEIKNKAIAHNTGGADLDKKEKIDALINCESTKWNEDHRDVLNTLDESVIDNMDVKMPDPVEVAPVAPVETPAPTPVANTASIEDPAYQDMLKVYNNKKVVTVANILKSETNKFTEESLNEMSLEHLENIASFIPQIHEPAAIYVGGVGNVSVNNSVLDDEPLGIPGYTDYSKEG